MLSTPDETYRDLGADWFDRSRDPEPNSNASSDASTSSASTSP
jgi:hypothetical protein